MSDPISVAIEAALHRVFDERLPQIIDAVRASIPPPQPQDDNPDRFVKLSAAAAMLGVKPLTLKRMERDGKLPSREKFGGSTGYRVSTINAIIADIKAQTEPPPQPERKQRRVARKMKEVRS